jgi:hypothetical protein
MTRLKRAQPDAGLREDVRQAIEGAFPDDVVEMPSPYGESWFHEVETKLGRDLRHIQGVGFFYEHGPEGLPLSDYREDDDLPAESQHSRSYHLFFVSPAGDQFVFTSETEDYMEPDDHDEESMAEPEYATVPVAGQGRVGWAVGVSLMAPFAVITLGEMTTFDNGTVSEPSLETQAETEDGTQITDPEAHFRGHAGEKAFAVLVLLRRRLEGILEKHGVAVLPETEWRKPAPWLRGSEDTFVGASGGPVRVPDAFFFEGL